MESPPLQCFVSFSSRLPLPVEGSTASSLEPAGGDVVSSSSSYQFVLGAIVQEGDFDGNHVSKVLHLDPFCIRFLYTFRHNRRGNRDGSF